MNNRPIAPWIWTAVFAIVGVVSFYILAGRAPVDQAFSTSVAIFASLLYMTAMVYYIRGLRHFSTGMRIAYSLLSVGIAINGIAVAQLSIVGLYNWLFWIDSGLIVLPYVVAIILIMSGLHKFASVVNIHSRWFSLRYAYGIAALAGVAASLLPHVPSVATEESHMATAWLTAFIAVLFIFAARGTLLIKNKLGTSYTHGLAWLSVAFAVGAISGINYIGELTFTSGAGWYSRWGFTTMFFTVAGLLFMKAGYAFSTLSLPVSARTYPARLRPFFGLPADARTGHDTSVSSMDIIVYAIGMTSDPARVDALLDDMRLVTSRLDEESQLSKQDQQTLLRTYRRLEDYLVKEEPLRKFSRQEVRSTIQKRFMLTSRDTATFWSQLA